MYTKSIFGVVFATLATFAVATPPACLLAAVNEQKNPVDVPKICKDNAKEVQELVVKVCKTDAQDALNYFADTCKTSGVTVEPFVIPTTTASTTSPTGTNSAGMTTVTGTGAPKPTTSNTSGSGGNGSGSGNGSGGQTTTPNSASMKGPSLAAAALLAAGIVFAV